MIHVIAIIFVSLALIIAIFVEVIKVLSTVYFWKCWYKILGSPYKYNWFRKHQRCPKCGKRTMQLTDKSINEFTCSECSCTIDEDIWAIIQHI